MTVYLSLGANLGNREQTISRATDRLRQLGTIAAVSDYFYSDPWGFESAHAFCNICLRMETTLSAPALLERTQAIERQLGRTHKSADGHYSDRVIDIDLIRAFDQKGDEIIISSPELTLPHPLWEQRNFVVIPLREVWHSLH